MATKTAGAPQLNGVPRKPAAPRAPVKKPATGQATRTTGTAARQAQSKAAPVQNKAASVAGGEDGGYGGAGSAYSIMANRIANRVAEMAESITFVERQKPQAQQQPEVEEKRRPRKLEMRLNGGTAESVAFSAPFLDNTLSKMLQLQNRMLKSSAELSKMEGVDERVMKEHAAQSAELSRIIALICAEKARQGA
ncbi:hypothetical protein KC367_g1273 [Hortaea werneckii]|uniref:Uncharacterized protein n=3 Tax=Hortaea werneckii TaxID=91943 RepID=A0A3M7HFQ9_HORWE|nr:hypothetical protein KC358_g10856 [Hortaea werneckii]OTA34811.1 hypothetical protein BTJ68_05379 [Hortaea werneckii EXF-2000]KAI6815687.1 hypothetical protein KC358_g10816 [Hortaea werneckii]KAI6819076.1 hypothetical protein KC350_g10156 [Hortaea werneckii]KAI6819258.1 hypothetical protein KC350_g10125 [Hortaea werneckii]